MKPRVKILLALMCAAAAAYFIFFTDFFRKETIQIVPQVRAGRQSAIPRAHDSAPVYPVAFKFDKAYRFTSIKVVNAAEYATNRFARPLWHLVADSHSQPITSVIYGLPKIAGMKPAVPRSKPQPLEANVQYLILVEAGKLKASTNFVTREYVPIGGR